jgi:hypothetical protein
MLLIAILFILPASAFMCASGSIENSTESDTSPPLLSNNTVSNNTVSNNTETALDNERAAVQAELINVLKKAYSIGAQLPELPSSYDDDNATIFVKLNIINPIDKRTNVTYLSASDFSITGTYQTKDGTSGGLFGPVNDAGGIFVIPASDYSFMEDTAQTGMEPRDSLLKSYSTSYSKDCSGQINYMETKDCIITKTYTNETGDKRTSQ